jgi:hypothetical protein
LLNIENSNPNNILIQSKIIDCYSNNLPKQIYDKKQKRAYNSLISGMQLAYHYNKKVRFLTLSTSDIQIEKEGYEKNNINESFRILKQRIQRLTFAKLKKDGYVQNSDKRRYYNEISCNQKFNFDYFKVTTNEGNGVLHIVYKGQYLPYNYLVDNWNDIHNSWELNIKLIKSSKKDYKKSSNYVISQYISNQESSYQRSSQSWNWIIRGYSKQWQNFLNELHCNYYYNPVKRRFYDSNLEVDIFKENLVELTHIIQDMAGIAKRALD